MVRSRPRKRCRRDDFQFSLARSDAYVSIEAAGSVGGFQFSLARSVIISVKYFTIKSTFQFSLARSDMGFRRDEINLRNFQFSLARSVWAAVDALFQFSFTFQFSLARSGDRQISPIELDAIQLSILSCEISSIAKEIHMIRHILAFNSLLRDQLA